MTHTPEQRGTTYVRFKDGKNEHDDKEEDVGRQNRHLIDALFGYLTHVCSI